MIKIIIEKVLIFIGSLMAIFLVIPILFLIADFIGVYFWLKLWFNLYLKS